MTVRLDIKPEFFDRRHPEYVEKKPHWDFVEATYKGGRGWFDDNIFKYRVEGSEEYKSRVERAYRFNHTREVVDLVIKYVTKSEIDRKQDAPETLKKFWKSATKSGASIRTLMSEIGRMSSVYGRIYVVTDSSVRASENGRKLTVAEMRKQNGRAYAYVHRPQDALDMSFDEEGRLNWIAFREAHRDDSDFFADQVNYIRYRLWTRTGWTLFRVRPAEPEELNYANAKVTEISLPTVRPSSMGAQQPNTRMVVEEVDSGEHNLGYVPVRIVDDRESDSEYSAPALVDDIAYLDRANANYLSNLDAIIQDQTFSQLTIPVQSLDKSSGDEYDALVEMGTKRIFAYDAEGGKGPEFISADPSQASIILSVITKIITEIYHSVGMAGERTKMDAGAGIDNSSGAAKAKDFDRLNTTLRDKAVRMEEVENDLCGMIMDWMGETADEDTKYVTYPEDFDTHDIYDEFDVANRLALLGAPDEVRRHQMQRMVDKMYPAISNDLKSKIKAEIAEWPAEEDGPISTESPRNKVGTPASENRQGQSEST